MRLVTPFRHNLPVPDEIFHLPIYVTGAGWELVSPGQSYPLPDASMYGFRWEEGRVLPEFCLAWLEEGVGHLETTRGKQEIPLRRAFFFRPGEWHRHRPDLAVGWRIYWITFNGSLPHEWLQEDRYELDGNLPVITEGHLFQLQLVRLVQTVHQTPTHNLPALSWQAVGLLSHFLTDRGPQQSEALLSQDDLVNRAVQFIWNHSHNFVDVSDVVAHVACTRRVLERRFKKILERSVLDEIQRCRLGRAKRLLAETSLPIKQVVYRAGLRSRQQLWLLFHKHLGSSPEDYRMSIQTKTDGATKLFVRRDSQ